MSKYDFKIDLSENSSTGLILTKIKPGSIVLEFGCATGRMTRYMKEALECQVYIVEYERAAFDQALQYAADGICDNILNYQWVEKFRDIKFDAIIFADVLEHLMAPEKVLEEASKLLSDDGCIYASVPNITHNDIILKAMDEHFDYTSIGILDDTHVHFWGLKNIEELSGKSGLNVRSIEATYRLTGDTEQYADQDNFTDLLILNILKERQCGEVYQFVITFDLMEHTVPIVKINRPSILSHVYLDYGDGFKPEYLVTFESEYSGYGSYIAHYVVNAKENIKRLRFDPIEGQSCILRNVSIHQGTNRLSLECENSLELNDGLLLMGEDPAICVDVPSVKKPITIDAEIIIMGKKYMDILSQKNEEQQRYEERQQYEEALRQLEYYKTNYPQMVSRMELAEAKYEMIADATFWKMTKPMRDCVEAVKNVVLFIKNKTTPSYTKNELKQQKKTKFSKNIKFSILVPLYNTKEEFLTAMIQSVQGQTYSKWELCLADGSDSEHTNVGDICKRYAAKDRRICYKKLDENKGISGNTNACIDMATGDFIALFDHDDLLHPSALYEMMTVICEQDADFVYTDETTFHNDPQDAYMPHYKPDYAPDTLRANNYICHFTAFDKSLLDKVGGFRKECEGSQDFDMVLRLTEQAKKIVHIPKILYYWRAHAGSVAETVGAKPYVIEAAHRAVEDHLKRVGLEGTVLDTSVPSMYRLHYEIKDDPLVSIIIPNYEHKSELKICLESLYGKSTYRNFEVIVVENNSKSEEIFKYYEEIQKRWKNLKVVTWDKHFNYSAINNFGAKFASGEHLLLLNNDTEVIAPDWIQEMLMYSQRNDVGAVGAKLYYPDDTIQHAGLGIGLLTLAGHYHRNFRRTHPGYMGRLAYAQNLSGVTAACMMIRKSVWDEVGGLDETFEVAFNDVDLCMRIRKANYLIVWTPFAELYHYESKSRGSDDAPEKRARFVGEVERFQKRWKKELEEGDPYYNPNLTLDKEDFSVKR